MRADERDGTGQSGWVNGVGLDKVDVDAMQCNAGGCGGGGGGNVVVGGGHWG
jgi:hypothetical protein